MKIYIECKSILLHKALSLFLEPFLCPYKQCDFVVSDYEYESKKPIFYIDGKNANLQKPFSKEKLLSSLNEFAKCSFEKNQNTSFEEQIDKLTKDFSQKMLQIIKDYYEK